ncbi:ralBP1-associated Eps domain-containing protein 1-like [Wyeomyia smithii]|uniref:ralBP1-associated Eps domain-containing protein 1-like n=1 Tax=Wyeomyia smithii TaxID=174621 RepID=UPI002467FDF6|nr:ralBP1-associated Eps domain-containing protein 1-like [Wyeomyia smithii]
MFLCYRITSLVGIPQTALHLSRQQFYGCLKLIAAYQASVPLREEILTSTLTLPLPQFSWIESPTTLPVSASGAGSTASSVGSTGMAPPERNGYGNRSADYIEMKGGKDLIELVTTSSSSSRERVDNMSNSGDMTNSDQPSTDSEVEHNDDSILRLTERHHVVKVKGQGVGKLVGGGTSSGVGGSPEAWSTASDSPTPTNSVAERPWANQALWQGLVCEEQRQLLGTEEESSDKHSSDDDQDTDLEYFYQISQTQKEYYLKQFRTNNNMSNSGDMTNSDQPSTDSEVEHNDDSILRLTERHHVVKVKGQGVGKLVGGGTSSGVGGSPEAWSTASDSPTPTNSVAERPWANQALWQGLVCEEQRQLLGTEEESSDKHSSDDDQDTELEYFYQISQTQKEYYLKQFRTIQPDVHGLVSGQVARVFFEKSRIPIKELRHIWQMCDVTRDGALNLAEFTAAMHLVVLRRNNIPVPSTLPGCLMPSLLQNSLLPGANTSNQTQQSGNSTGGASTGGIGIETGNSITDRERIGPEEADLLHLESDDNTDSGNRVNIDKKDYQRIVSHPEQLKFSHQLSTTGNSMATATLVSVGSIEHSSPTVSSTTGNSKLMNNISRSGRKTQTNLVSPLQHSKTKPSKNEQSMTPPNNLNNKEWNISSKEWTKFTESPTSNVSSPGPKPVNFDMQRTTQAIVSDPQILHPVPLRVTPVGAEAADNSNLVYSDVTVGTGGILIVQQDDSSPKQLTQLPQQPISNQRDSLTSGDLRAIQRPQPKKPPSKGVGAIPPPPQREPSVTSASGSVIVVDSMATSLDTATFNSVINSTAGHPVMGTVINSASKKDQPPPPLPPPRPAHHRHTRSSSLDLNKLKLNTTSGVSGASGLTKQLEDQLKMPPPPEVPPRVTPTSEQLSAVPGFADFAHFSNTTTTGGTHMNPSRSGAHPSRSGVSNSLIVGTPSLQTASRNSAFEVYRKPQQQHSRGSQSPPHPVPPLLTSRSVESSSLEYEKRMLALSDNLRQVRLKGNECSNGSDVLKHLKEQNLLLLRICNDLSEELLQIQQKREDIRIKIELQEQNLGAGTSTVTVSGAHPTSSICSSSHHAV